MGGCRVKTGSVLLERSLPPGSGALGRDRPQPCTGPAKPPERCTLISWRKESASPMPKESRAVWRTSMGAIVSASCACGYKCESNVGGSRANFQTVCHFPCLCETCREVVQVNLLSERPSCPSCSSTSVTPYDQTRLSTTKGGYVTMWRKPKPHDDQFWELHAGNYLCPKCAKMSLRFEEIGHFS